MFYDFVPPFIFWAWLNFFFMDLHVPSLCWLMPLLERIYGIWNIKEDMSEWMVWNCYPSGVEVLACGGGVYVILDHERMTRNSQRSQNLTKLKKTQVACRKVISL